MESDAMEEEDAPVGNRAVPRPASVFTRKLRRVASSTASVDAPPEEEDNFGHYRVQITAMIRNVFDTEVEANSLAEPRCRVVKQFIALYKKIKKAKPKAYVDIIIDECRLRMNFIVEDMSHYDGRYRVLVFFVIAALRLYYDYEEEHLLQLMLDYAIVYANTENHPNIRANCLRMCSLLIKYWLMEPLGKGEQKHMPPAVRDQIYRNLMERQSDKVVTVRHSCVLAIAEIQDMSISNDFKMGVECSPKDMMFKACQDLAAQVQIAAITTVDLTNCTEYHIDKLIGLACGHPNLLMKQEAIKRLGKVHLSRFNKEKLQDLLLTVLADVEEVTDVVRQHMLAEWIIKLALGIARQNGHPSGRKNGGSGERILGIGSAILCFLNQLDCTKWRAKRDVIVFAMLDCARWVIAPKKKLNIAELVISLVTDKCKPMIWSRNNKEPIFKEQLDHSAVALHLYLWRCIVQYCQKKTAPGMPEDNEAMRDECFQRLLCPLTNMADILEAIWKRDELDTYEELPLLPEDELSYMKAISEAIKLCNFTPIDPHGGKKYLDILTELVLYSNNHVFITDLIGLSLGKVLHNEEGNEDRDPSSCCPCQTFLEVFLDRSRLFIALDKEVDENSRREMDREQRIAIISYAIQALHGILRNKEFHTDFKFMETTMLKLMENRDVRSDEKTMGLVIKCATIWMMGNEDTAKKHFIWLEHCFHMEFSKNKAIAVNCYYDLANHYGIKKFDGWRAAAGHERTWVRALGFFLFNYPKNAKDEFDEDFFVANCEVACKYLLNDERSPDPRGFESGLITGLCSQYFRPEGLKNKRFREMFIQFTMIYIQQSKTHIVRYFFGILSTATKMLKKYSDKQTDAPKPVTIGDIEMVITAAAAWCREDVLHTEGETTVLASEFAEKYEINHMFMLYVLQRVPERIGHDGLMDIFVRVISGQDPARVPEAQIENIQRNLIRVFEAVDEFYGPKHYYRQVLTRLQQELDKNFDLEIKQEPDDEYSEGTTTRIVKRKIPLGQSKGKKFISVQKYRVIKKNVVFEEEGLNPEPEEAPTSSRAHLARTARRKNFFDFETLVE